MKKNYPLIELNLAVFFISTSGIFGRLIKIPPELIIFYRCLIAFILLGLFVKFKNLDLRIKSRSDLYLIIIAGVLMGLHWVTYFYSLAFSSIAIAMLTLHAFPAMTAILEPLILKTKFKMYHLLLATLVIIGVYIILPSVDFNDKIVIAIFAGLASALFYALRNIYTKRVIKTYNGSVLMWFQLLIMTLMMMPFLFFKNADFIKSDWTYIFALALITTCIGHTLLVKNLKHFSAVTVSLVSSIIPVYGILFGLFLLNEIPSIPTLIGGTLIMTSFIIEIYMNAKKSSKLALASED